MASVALGVMDELIRTSFNLCSRQYVSLRYVALLWALPAPHTFLLVGWDVELFNLVNNILQNMHIVSSSCTFEVEMPKGVKCQIGESLPLEVIK